MDFHTRMGLFLRNRSQLANFMRLPPKKSENDHPTTIFGTTILINPNLPPGTAMLVTDTEVVLLTDIAEDGCEICGEPDAEARHEDADIWCWACFVEQCPEEAN